MGTRFWEALDTLAHRVRFPWRRWVCHRYDVALGLYDDDEDFCEADEPVEKIVAAFERGPKFVTGKSITDEINADPAEVARLRLSRQEARAGPQWSPPLTGGMTDLRARPLRRKLAPQWSPPLTGGMTAPSSRPGPRSTGRNGARP